MESRPQLLILADPPGAFSILCGVSLLERTLRIAQRLGFREATILAESVETVKAHLAAPSWARAELALRCQPRSPGPMTIEELLGHINPANGRALIVAANFYYDARLLRALADQTTTTLLVDSAPPLPEGPREPAALLDQSWMAQQEAGACVMDALGRAAAAGRIQVLDAARESTYVADLRKHVRPVFFAAPMPAFRRAVEGFIQEAAQNGVLDFPALVHAPIETWLVSKIWRTAITPNQITFFTMLIGLAVTALFASGHLWQGTALALLVGVLDGVDGKLARTKIETTELGKLEHSLDYVVELSWWTALAYHFHERGGEPRAYWLLLVLVGSDLLDRFVKRSVKRRLGRNLDDVSAFDRFVRYLGGRRNIYIWLFGLGLAVGVSRSAFMLLCLWGAATAAVHVVRWVQIGFGRSERIPDHSRHTPRA